MKRKICGDQVKNNIKAHGRESSKLCPTPCEGVSKGLRSPGLGDLAH